MAFLKIEHLCKRYDDFQAVTDLNLDVEQGEFISLLGPSGCGKTTTLQMIAGFIEPSDGFIIIKNKHINDIPPEKRGVGIVFQSYALFPHMTVIGNIQFGLNQLKLSKAEQSKRISKVTKLVNLEDYLHRYPHELSGGQRQRVAVARALVMQPNILLLDEPMSNLDARLRKSMQVELRKIQQAFGITTVLVTHDQSEAMLMSDRIAVMNQGHVLQFDTPYEIYHHPRAEFVSSFVGDTNCFSGTALEESANPAKVQVKGQSFLCQNNGAEGKVKLFIRPENITVTTPEQGTLAGKISDTLFMGSHRRLTVSTDFGEIIADVSSGSHMHYQLGEIVGLNWDANDAWKIQDSSV